MLAAAGWIDHPVGGPTCSGRNAIATLWAISSTLRWSQRRSALPPRRTPGHRGPAQRPAPVARLVGQHDLWTISIVDGSMAATSRVKRACTRPKAALVRRNVELAARVMTAIVRSLVAITGSTAGFGEALRPGDRHRSDLLWSTGRRYVAFAGFTDRSVARCVSPRPIRSIARERSRNEI